MPRRNQDAALLYVATQSLDVKYEFTSSRAESATVVVPAVDIHADLYATCTDMLDVRSSMRKKDDTPAYKKLPAKINLSTAAITLLFTDTTPDEGYLGEEVTVSTAFPLSVAWKRNRVIACSDLYGEAKYQQAKVTPGKGARDALFNQRLFARVDAFSEIAKYYDVPKNVNANQAELQKAIEGEMFHETYHHSEQAEMDILSSPLGIDFIVQLARYSRAEYMYGIVLDIYTQRMLCNNCNACLLGLQHSHENGFLNDVSEALMKERIQARNGEDLMLSTRVSASQAGRGSNMYSLKHADDKGHVHRYDADDTPRVYQAVNKALGTEKALNQKGRPTPANWSSLFASQTFDKVKFEDALNEIVAADLRP